MRERLPIDEALPDLLAALNRGRAAVLEAPTGAGKTTRVPPALLDAGFAKTGRIVLVEPRRLAARAAARRIAAERGVALGTEVGYSVRFDARYGPKTRLLVVTPGVFLRMFQDDSYLETTSLVILDEFHERGLETDLALGLIRLVQETVRPDLSLVAMSATLDTRSTAAYLGDCPIITSAGRMYPVTVWHEPRPKTTPLAVAVSHATERLLNHTSGHLLIFLPGMQEIRQVSRVLSELPATAECRILPLHGDLSPEDQDAALLFSGSRKILLATNVAETSVTVEGVTGVIDSGLAREMRFDPSVGLDRLQLVPISQASAAQRTGRAGRTEPGICLRLWSAVSERARAAQTTPEIRRVDVTGAILQLLALGESDLDRFPWLESPSSGQIEAALTLLRRLGALEELTLTPLGREMARLPLSPRLGRLLLEGQRLGCAPRAALAAALLAERDPFRRNSEAAPLPVRRGGTISDVLERVEALEEHERSGRTQFPLGTLSRGSFQQLRQARSQLLRALPKRPTQDQTGGDEALLRALLAAFPDRVAKRREPGGRRGVLLGGRGVRLSPSSAVGEGELFLAIDVDAAEGEGLVHQASLVRREWLPPHLLRTSIEVEFDDEAEKVVARKKIRYEDLILEENHAAFPEDDTTAQILAQAAAQRLDRVLPPPESPAASFLLRARCLRVWMPELDLPELGEALLREILPELTQGCRSFADLRKADWLEALRGRLSYAQRQALDREAPERLELPSGHHGKLTYEEGRPPILAARIQEFFGWQETPRLGGGRVRVLLHLLGPNYRPQQVTDDLASFWVNTYPQVRKDLRARYPKHAWPEDPRTAVAKRR